MSLQEYYDTNDNTGLSCDSGVLAGQTFTPVTTHMLQRIDIKGSCSYSGTATVEIKAADVDHKPTGSTLGTSGSVSLSSWTTDSAGSWVALEFSTPVEVTADTEYVLIFHPSNTFLWRVNTNTGDGYSRGVTVGYSGSWVVYAARDYMFREYSPSPNTSINIGDTFEEIDWPGSKINIGDVWKAIAEVYVNIGDTWKLVYAAATGDFLLLETNDKVLQETGDKIKLESST